MGIGSAQSRVSIYFDGLSHAQEALATLPAKIQSRVVRLAARKAAKPVADAARSNAPVDSGTLRGAIQVVTLRSRKFKNIVKVAVTPGKKWFNGDAYYAGFIEFGYMKAPTYRANGKILSKKRSPDRSDYEEVLPRPFLRPALDQAKSQVMSIFRNEISKGIAREVVKIARTQLKASGTAVEKLDTRSIRKIARAARG